MTAKARVVDQNTTTTAFSYDALDRTESMGNTTFAYGCDGNRIAKNTTETVWDNDEVSADLIGDTVWLNRAQLAELFDRDVSVIGRHINAVFKEKELTKERNVQNLHIPNRC